MCSVVADALMAVISFFLLLVRYWFKQLIDCFSHKKKKQLIDFLHHMNNNHSTRVYSECGRSSRRRF